MKRDSETEFEALASELARMRRRAARQKRHIGSRPQAWQDWSATMDEIAALTQSLVARPADDVRSLQVKFDAILWLIGANESMLDSNDLRRLRRFSRELSILAGAS